jgi:hypothetical protein
MDVSPLQEAWQIRVTTRTMRIKAQTAYLEAKRQQMRAREQQECLRLQQAMPGAHAWVIELAAWLLSWFSLGWMVHVHGKRLPAKEN